MYSTDKMNMNNFLISLKACSKSIITYKLTVILKISNSHLCYLDNLNIPF